MQSLQAPLAIVDLETTGGQPGWDRVTEIAVIEVDGFEVSGEWILARHLARKGVRTLRLAGCTAS